MFFSGLGKGDVLIEIMVDFVMFFKRMFVYRCGGDVYLKFVVIRMFLFEKRILVLFYFKRLWIFDFGELF